MTATDQNRVHLHPAPAPIGNTMADPAVLACHHAGSDIIAATVERRGLPVGPRGTRS